MTRLGELNPVSWVMVYEMNTVTNSMRYNNLFIYFLSIYKAAVSIYHNIYMVYGGLLV